MVLTPKKTVINTIPTPLKFNMEPEKKFLEKEIPNLETIIFRFHVEFRGSNDFEQSTNILNTAYAAEFPKRLAAGGR